jgi:type VI secretion system secreted protein VgrG
VATLELKLATNQTDVFVRQFAVRESISNPFTINLLVCSSDHSLDFDNIVGAPASFRMHAGYAYVAGGGARSWSGIVSNAEQIEALQDISGKEGLSTYVIEIVPKLWLLNHRRGNRIFQHLTIPDIITKLLGEWAITPQWRIDRAAYPKLEYKVQYAESDYDFMCRLLEEAGIAFTFAEGSGIPIFGDALEHNEPRAGSAIPYVDTPNETSQREYVTEVRLGRDVRPGAVTYRDYDPRKPAVSLFGTAPSKSGVEGKLEQYHYDAGAFFAETGKSAGTPAADDLGFARHDPEYGKKVATRTLEGNRSGENTLGFAANTFDLAPGSVFSIARHPHGSITEKKRLLAVSSKLTGSDTGDFSFTAEAHFADAPYRPARKTPKPIIHGLQSATVVGPKGQEIHTDEFGRVRVQFPWDREGKNDEHSSCWIRVNQGWGGAGFGNVTLPRIGQEVLVAFLEGDPDCPIVAGRVYNAAQTVPHKLPQHKTRSTWKSDSSLGSNGFNEVMFEDLAGQELVWQQAEKDRTRSVTNDEFATIVHDRQKLVKNDEDEHTLGNRQILMGKDFDVITKKNKNETYHANVHQVVKGNRAEKVDGKQSVSVQKERHEKVDGRVALVANDEVHHVAGQDWIGEGGGTATIKAPGGFISIHGGGISIVGTMVWINERGEPGDGKVAKPEWPFDQEPPDEKAKTSQSEDDHAPAQGLGLAELEGLTGIADEGDLT